MKIFAVARNYGLSSPASPFGEGPEPIWYEIPDSSILRSGQPFFIPDFSEEFRAFPSLAIKIGRLGKSIAERFAPRYIAAQSIACSIVGTSLLANLRRDSLPWSKAIAFDKSCTIGGFHENLPGNCKFRISSDTNELTYSIEELRLPSSKIISLISRDITLKEGDIILTALHPEGLPLIRRENLSAESEGNRLLEIHIR